MAGYGWYIAGLFSFIISLELVNGYADPAKLFSLNRKSRSLATKRDANQRVSFKECNLDVSERRDCGHPGITQEDCARRECCYHQTDEVDVPWCYHSKRTMGAQCVVETDEKLACGSYGVRKEQCLALDCCWQPSSSDAPWCYHVRRLPIIEGECGVPAISPNVRSRIVNGVEARPHSWPWIVSMRSYGSHNCGASIINNHWLLSAAHCWPGAYRKRSIKSKRGTGQMVIIGLHSQSDLSETTVIEVEVQEAFVHEDFETHNPENYLENDILLMKLAEPLEFSDVISPICLPEQDEEFPGGLHAYAAGWGATRGQPHYDVPETLQQVMLPLVDRDVCNDWYEESFSDGIGFHEFFSDRPIMETMQCAGYEEGGRSACYGDSGGPLVVYKQDHWVQVGITSWVGDSACNLEKMPPVYTKVASHIDWIVNIISRHSD